MIIDELEGSLTGSPIDTTNPEVPKVTAESNADEDITAGAKVNEIKNPSDEMEIDLEEE